MCFSMSSSIISNGLIFLASGFKEPQEVIFVLVPSFV